MSSVPAGFDINKLKDRNYKGDDFNVKASLGEGPFNERRCTDVFMCIFFCIFLGGMGFCTAYGYANGDPNKLIAPIDGDGNICGVTPGYEDYGYLFIGNIDTLAHNLGGGTSTFHYGICVEGCPATSDDSETALSCKTTTRVTSCNMTETNAYAAYSVMGYCMPEYDTLSSEVQEHWDEME